tara:strand:+ start:1683 stop:2594 length:912 start_codon:yes stop_codon:yes gene_type:complete
MKISHLAKYFTLISVLIGGVGIIISSTFLSSYNLSLDQALNPKIFYIGFVFLFILLMHAVFYYFNVNIANTSKYKKAYLVGITFNKMILASVFLQYLLSQSEVKMEYWPSDNFLMLVLLLISMEVILMNVILFIKDKNRASYLKYVHYPTLITILILSVAYIVYNIRSRPLQGVLAFEILIGIFILFSYRFIQEDLDIVQPKIDRPPYTSFMLGFNGMTNVVKLFYASVVTIAILSIVFIYSLRVFEYIPKSLGGGNPQKSTIILSNDTITGNIITHTDQYIFLEKDSTIYKLDWEDVKALKK